MTTPITTASAAPASATDLQGALTEISETLTSLAGVGGASLEAELARLDSIGLVRAIARLEQVSRLVAGLQVALTGQVVRRRQTDPDCRLGMLLGMRTSAGIVRQITGVSARAARTRVHLAEQVCTRPAITGGDLPPLHPHVSEALRAGLISTEAAQLIIDELRTASDRAHPDAVAVAEQHLVEAATHLPEPQPRLHPDGHWSTGDDRQAPAQPLPEWGLPPAADSQTEASSEPCLGRIGASPELLRVQARAWRDALDPDGVEPRYEQALRRRDFSISRTARDGLHTVRGAIPPDVAAKGLAILDALLKPSAATTDGDGEPPHDLRTLAQRRADAFAAMVQSFSGDARFTTPPAVVVTMTQGAETGRISGVSTPIPRSVLRQLSDDGGTQHATVDRAGALIALSSAQRVFTAQQRRALVARDGHECVIPGCGVPATACEAHHVTEWQHGGPTSIDNGVLLCWWHHRSIDTGPWRIHMQRGAPVITHRLWHDQHWRPGDLRPGDLRPGDLRPGDLRPADLRPAQLLDRRSRPAPMRAPAHAPAHVSEPDHVPMRQ